MKNLKRLAVYLAVFSLCSIAAEAHAQATTDINRINGIVPPGEMARSIREEPLLKEPDGKGNEAIVARTTRAAGTRTPVHMHEFGGMTCVLEGEMTLYLEGAEPHRAVAGQCYYMPAGKAMAGVNTGTTTAIMHDIFLVPAGKPVWKVVEDGGKSLQDQFTKHH